jgi:hypothetical protein
VQNNFQKGKAAKNNRLPAQIWNFAIQTYNIPEHKKMGSI